MATSGVSLPSTFWSLVRRNRRVLIKSCSRPWAWASFLAFELSTHRFHTYNWWGIIILGSKKQNKFVINVLPPTDRTVWHEENGEESTCLTPYSEQACQSRPIYEKLEVCRLLVILRLLDYGSHELHPRWCDQMQSATRPTGVWRWHQFPH